MLVLSRKAGERILIGDQVRITVVRVAPNGVRIGIEAPADMIVVREELSDETTGSEFQPSQAPNESKSLPSASSKPR